MTNMKTSQGILLLILFSLFSFQLTAQRDKAADGDVEFMNGGYTAAASLYKNALPKIKDIDEKGRVLFQIAECYRNIDRLEESEEWYRKSITAKFYKKNPNVILNFAKVLMQQGKYDEAIVQLNRYKEKGGDDRLANELIQTCDKATEWIDVPPTRYVIENEVILNTKNYDFSPRFSNEKQNELVLSSSRPSSTGIGEDPISGDPYMDLFMASQDRKDKWSTPVPLGSFVNTENNEGAAEFNADFTTMYLTRCKSRGDDRVGCRIYSSSRTGSNFSTAYPIIIDYQINDTIDVGHPALLVDQKHMVFSSNMPGGKGGVDLWIVEYDDNIKKWVNPKNLGDKINTSGDEAFPFIRDNGTLYYSSDGLDGLGGFDIFAAESTGENTWGEPQNLQYPINSSAEDFGIIYRKGVDAGYFSSDRAGGKGLDDIYSFKMPPLVFSYVATIYDNDSGEPISGARVVIAETPGGGSWEVTTDGNGGFALNTGEIKKENTYSMAISKDGYISTSGEFSTVGLTESADLVGEHFLDPIVEGKSYPMPLVLYPFGSAELLINDEVNSADSLNYLLKLMNDNPTFVIELQSHTDSRGGDAANMELSQRRAKTCVDYLISKGIASDRLTAKGMGETALLISDAEINALPTEEEREAAHQKNRRTVFRIIRYDYVPKGN